MGKRKRRNDLTPPLTPAEAISRLKKLKAKSDAMCRHVGDDIDDERIDKTESGSIQGARRRTNGEDDDDVGARRRTNGEDDDDVGARREKGTTVGGGKSDDDAEQDGSVEDNGDGSVDDGSVDDGSVDDGSVDDKDGSVDDEELHSLVDLVPSAFSGLDCLRGVAKDLDPDAAAAPVALSARAFDVEFHPSKNIVAAALVSGDVVLYKFDEANDESNASIAVDYISSLTMHEGACRVVKFFPSGRRMLTGSSDCCCVVADQEGKVTWKVTGHSSGVNSAVVISNSTFASGDDDGIIKIWDTRAKPVRPISKFNEYSEYVSDMKITDSGHHLLATSGDKFAVYDIRKSRASLFAMSDPFAEDLLSITIVRCGTKVLVGSEGGRIWIFSWGNFGFADDAIKGHEGKSVDSLLNLNDDVVITGSSDGILRIVTVFPNKIIGNLGRLPEGKNEIDCTAANADGTLVASCLSMDQQLVFLKTKRVKQLRTEKSGGNIVGRGHFKPHTAGTFFADL